MMDDFDGVINFCVICVKNVKVVINNSVCIRPVDMIKREPDTVTVICHFI